MHGCFGNQLYPRKRCVSRKTSSASCIHQRVASSALYNTMQAVSRCRTPIGSYRRRCTTHSKASFRDIALIVSGLGTSPSKYKANGWRHLHSVFTGAWRLMYATDCHHFCANGEVSFRSMSTCKIWPSLTLLLIKRLAQM